MNYDRLLGFHGNTDSNRGITIQEFYALLKQIPIKVRESNYMRVVLPDDSMEEVRGLQFAQSDQAESWEFKVYVEITKGGSQ